MDYCRQKLGLISSLIFALTLSCVSAWCAPTPQDIQQAEEALGVSKTAARDETPSAFEDYVSSATGNPDIKQFGYDLFNEVPSTFAPVDIVPVGPDYLLGPGDELRVVLWGKVNLEHTIMIDRDGSAVIPEMGVLHLAGLTFEGARTLLERELYRFYKPAEVKINVSTGRLKTIRVFLVGKVMKPGSYTISSLSTLINALFAAGGPSKVGTLRDIQVNRAGNTIVHFDVYDFLLKGDKTKDVRLMSEDVIFVPSIGPLAGVAGSVKVPAIYELKGESTVREIISMAGGFNDIAFKGRLQIERIVNNNRQTVFESPIESVKPEDIQVRSGDLIKVFQVVPDKKIVRLSGAVLRDGEYGLGEGLTIKELITFGGGLKYYAYTDDAELTRITVTQNGPVTTKIHVDIKKALDGDPANNIELQQDDYLFVRNVPEWDLYKTVSISGEVRFPGTYTVKKGETLSSMIERAGGFTDKAYLKGAVFTRESVRALQQKQLDEAITRLEHQMLSESVQALQTAVSPEEAALQKAAAEQRRALIGKMKAAKAAGRLSIKLSELNAFRGSPSDLALENGDTLHVPGTPAQVQIIGAVYNQTAMVYNKDLTASNYLQKAGGLTSGADEGELYVLKVDGTAVSKREGGGFMSARLDPGDTIVVPEKLEKIAWLREIKDLTQILYQIAVTAGVLIVVF